MTDTHATTDVRRLVHDMWANLAPAWEANADDVDRRAAPVTERMLEAAGVRRGDRVLDLACGPGGAGLAAADRVGADGEVVLSDVVPGMVEAARRRATAHGAGNVRAEILDLEDIAQPDATYDVVLCREGLMFALDPVQAVTEMRRVLRSAGRVAVAVWGARRDNPWLGLLIDAITEVTGIVVPPPGVPGPFALGDRDRLRALFADRGFVDLRLEPVAVPLLTPSFDTWWTRNLTVAGPVVRLLAGLDDDTRARVARHRPCRGRALWRRWAAGAAGPGHRAVRATAVTADEVSPPGREGRWGSGTG